MTPRRSRLDDKQLERFVVDGFVVVRRVFEAAEVAAFAAAFDRLADRAQSLPQESEVVEHVDVDGSVFVVERTGGRTRIHRVVWAGACEPVLSQFGEDPRLLVMASQILGSDVADHLINQAHFKLPGDEVEFPWHQDSRHRRYGTPLWTDVNGRGSFVEIAVAVDPMTRENGPLQFIPGSGAAGHIDVDPHNKALPSSAVDESRAVALTMNPGDAVLFSPYVIHGSEPNRSSASRRLFLNGFAFPGANKRVYPGRGAGRRVELR